MTVQRIAFAQYWKSVDAIMEETFGIVTCDAGIEPGELACARSVGITPEDFVLTFGEKYGLTPLSEFRANWGRS